MKRSLPIGLLLLVCMSCMQEPETGNLVQHMVVQTSYNEDFINSGENIFDSYSTFVIREDTIGFVSNLSDTEYLVEEDVPGFVTPVVNAIRNGFAQDYQQVTDAEGPDFAVNVVVLENFSYYQSYNYGYGYPGSYYSYYGYYYPMVTTYYSNNVTLLIQVVDAKNPNFENKFPIIWSAYIGDLGATADLAGKTLEAIDQAFAQSPYLKKN